MLIVCSKGPIIYLFLGGGGSMFTLESECCFSQNLFLSEIIRDIFFNLTKYFLENCRVSFLFLPSVRSRYQ